MTLARGGLLVALMALMAAAGAAAERSNVVIIYGDDVGAQTNIAVENPLMVDELRPQQQVIDAEAGIRQLAQ